VCQAAALGNAALAVVEPILVLELPFTLALATVVFHRRIAREWVAAVAMAGGLALLIASLSPTGGSARHTGTIEWVFGVGVTAAVVAALVGAARTRAGSERATLLGVATGVPFGLTAALMTAMSEAFALGFSHIFVTWQTYVMVASGLSAMFLLQTPSRRAPCWPPSPASRCWIRSCRSSGGCSSSTSGFARTCG